MVRRQLEQRLTIAVSNDEWVEALAQLFTAHGLVFGHGTDNAGDEAYWLVRHLQQWQDTVWEAPPDRGLISRVVELAERRIAERKPLAYLLGEAWFAGLPFNVDERVLVPRSPLAEVIERGFEPWCELKAGDRVLDIGTGSGCLAIAAAVHCPDVLVDATDVSAAALRVAGDNVARHALRSRVRLFQADLFPPSAHRYRVIMSNPPYVPESELAALPPEYADEPVVALAGGATGLEAADRILRGARDRLEPGGVLIMEVGGGAEGFVRAYPELPVIWIEFERGGDGVFVLAAEQLVQFPPAS